MILDFICFYVRRILWCIKNRFDIRLALLCDISLKSTIPKTTSFTHPLGIIIGDNIKIGENCLIRQNVTIGGQNKDVPTIGNNVEIGANAIILKKIIIEDNSKIGAGAIVLKDVPKNKTVVGLWK